MMVAPLVIVEGNGVEQDTPTQRKSQIGVSLCQSMWRYSQIIYTCIILIHGIYFPQVTESIILLAGFQSGSNPD